MRERAPIAAIALVLLGGCGDDETTAAGTGGNLSPRRVFVTSGIYEGNLGGLQGADAKCQASADAAMLGGTWLAWLSQDGVNAIARMVAGGAWYRVDRTTLVFRDVMSLAGGPANAIETDENGMPLPDIQVVWTGTLAGGTASTLDCTNWTGVDETTEVTSGVATGLGTDWTDSPMTGVQCHFQLALYCFEQ
jgi:hypothetical protein